MCLAFQYTESIWLHWPVVVEIFHGESSGDSVNYMRLRTVGGEEDPFVKQDTVMGFVTHRPVGTSPLCMEGVRRDSLNKSQRSRSAFKGTKVGGRDSLHTFLFEFLPC